MFSFVNRTVFDIPLTWDRHRFEATRSKCRQARQLIHSSVTVQYEKHLREVYQKNLDVEKESTASDEQVRRYETKSHVVDNLKEVASQSLPTYFDQRIEHVRSAVREHCNAIQRIIREENEHWQEMHSAIDQNLITASDFNRQKDDEPMAEAMQTIHEAHEPETTSNRTEIQPQESLQAHTIQSTHSLTASPSERSSNTSTESDEENAVPTKEEQQSTVSPQMKSARTLSSIETVHALKLEDTTCHEAVPSTSLGLIPTENSPALSTTQVEASPIYSQPNLPARLYFSPTLLLEEESEAIKQILSPVDQNQISKPKVALRRLGQTFVLDRVKTEEAHENHDTENIDIYMRPKITDHVDLADAHVDQPVFVAPTLMSKRRTRAAVKAESASICQKQPIEPKQRATRKRKQSVSDEMAAMSTTINLRKRRAIPVVDLEEKKPKKKPKKTIVKKRKNKKTDDEDIPIREPSPLPVFDRSKHYSTRFSTRSHRFNNFTLSAIPTESDDDSSSSSKNSKARSRLRTKSLGRPRKEPTGERAAALKPKKPGKSTIITRKQPKRI